MITSFTETPRTPIRCYVSPTGRNKIADWYNDLLSREKAFADDLVASMMKIQAQEWKLPQYRPALGGGIGELRWFAGRKQHRLLGFFDNGVWYAVIGCTHKQQIYDPVECLETAKKRKKEIEQEEVSTVEYDL